MLPFCWLGKKVLCLISPNTDNSKAFKITTEVIFPKRIIAIPDKRIFIRSACSFSANSISHFCFGFTSKSLEDFILLSSKMDISLERGLIFQRILQSVLS